MKLVIKNQNSPKVAKTDNIENILEAVTNILWYNMKIKK